MCVRYHGAELDEQAIPGGGPQGGLLTVLFFDLQVNLAGAPCPTARVLPVGVLGPKPAQTLHGPLPPCHQPKKINKKKYVDDLSMLERIDLKTALIPSPNIVGLDPATNMSYLVSSYPLKTLSCNTSWLI